MGKLSVLLQRYGCISVTVWPADKSVDRSLTVFPFQANSKSKNTIHRHFPGFMLSFPDQRAKISYIYIQMVKHSPTTALFNSYSASHGN